MMNMVIELKLMKFNLNVMCLTRRPWSFPCISAHTAQLERGSAFWVDQVQYLFLSKDSSPPKTEKLKLELNFKLKLKLSFKLYSKLLF